MSSVSVIIPTYKASPFIRETLGSVFAQTRLPDEIVVVDDCSPDDTVDVVERIARDAPVPVRVIRLPANSGGPAKPLTLGFDEAKGDFLAALDQDDVFLPGKLLRQTALLEQDPDVCCAFGGCAKMAASDQICHRAVFDTLAESGKVGVITGPRMHSLLLSHGQYLIGFPGFMFRRTAWDATRPLDFGLRIAADYDFLCRLCWCGKFAVANESHYMWRSHDHNLTKQGLQTIIESALILRRELKLLSRHSAPTDEAVDRNQLIRCVRRNLRRELLDAAYTYRRQNRFKEATATCAEAVGHGAVWSGLVEGAKIIAAAILAGFGSWRDAGGRPRGPAR